MTEFEDEWGTLYICTTTNHVRASGTRKWASDMMRGWWAGREKAGTGDEEAVKWLKQGTLAVNYTDVDGKSLAQTVVGCEHVVGMYFQPFDDIQKRAVQAQEKIADAVVRDLNQGEEWKDDEDG